MNMDDAAPNGEWPERNDETREIWDTNAEWWDDRIGDGNSFQDVLIEPATERLIEIAPGTMVLDIGCGAGRFSRRMAELGATVLATDYSERFIARARARTPGTMRNIEYRVLDATDLQQLHALGSGCFDGAVATMCLMDMCRIEPLMSALPTLLKPGGWFVFSIIHPCFQPADTCKFAESVEADGRLFVRRGVKVTIYATPTAYRGIGIVGQPRPQWYFHRPLHTILGAGFRHGFAVDGFEEPHFPERPDDKRYLMWENLPEIPPIIVVRMRLLAR